MHHFNHVKTFTTSLIFCLWLGSFLDLFGQMEGFSKAKVAIGRPSPVKFNFGVVGETGAGRRTFIKAFTEPYDFNHSDCQVNVVPDAELTSTSLRNKHNQWLDGYKRPATDEVTFPLPEASNIL